MGSAHQHHSPPIESYTDAVHAWRQRKDQAFRGLRDSPIPEPQRASFPGLAYYPVDEDLVFEGLELEPYPDADSAFFEIAGAIGAFLIVFELQVGQTSRPFFACASYAAESRNQPSKPWPLAQRRSRTFMMRTS